MIKQMLNNKAILGAGVGIAVRKGDSEHLNLINTALAEIHANGTYDKLEKKYFAFKVYP